MTKKNDKRLCWNCDGSVALHLTQCPYCGVNLSKEPENMPYNEFASPFQSHGPSPGSHEGIPSPPYANLFNKDMSVSEEEWDTALGEEGEPLKTEEEDISTTTRREMIALLLLLPGVVFALFGLALLLFSSEGVLTLKWNQSFAYFYFMGAIPLLFLGWRALR